MLSLNSHIHLLWGRGLVGLKWIGEVEATEVSEKTSGQQPDYAHYQVQWRVLPQNVAEAIDKRNRLIQKKGVKCPARWLVDLDSPEASEAVKEVLVESLNEANIPSTNQTIVIDQDGQTVQSGSILTFKVKREDLPRVKSLIEMQWLAIKMAAISGAGEAPDELRREPPPAFVADFAAMRELGVLGQLDDVEDTAGQGNDD